MNEDKLVTKYFEITGGLTALWNGEEKTITELQSYLQNPDRHIRKKAKTLISETFLSVEDKLQHILNELIVIRDQKSKKTFNYIIIVIICLKKHERFDYTPEDCYELAESIRKYVVPLIDKIYNKKKSELQVESLRPWDLKATAPNQKVLKPIEKASDLIEKSSHILHKLDPEFSALLERMHKNNCLDLESRKEKDQEDFANIYLHLNYLLFS